MEEERKSKTQIKREMKALHSLGEELVGLRADQLAALPLDETLRQAIILAQGIRARGGKKRQIKYIGKLLRDRDSGAILETLGRWRQRERRNAAALHRVERWRERLLEEGDQALSDLLEEFPDADRRRIRLLMRKAGQESSAGKPPAAARALFRYLRELVLE